MHMILKAMGHLRNQDVFNGSIQNIMKGTAFVSIRKPAARRYCFTALPIRRKRSAVELALLSLVRRLIRDGTKRVRKHSLSPVIAEPFSL